MKDTKIYLEACKEGREFLDTQSSLAEAWNNCENVDWLLWSLRFVNYSDSALRLYACACIRETPLGDGRKVWDLLATHNRTIVEIAERFATGEVTRGELAAALKMGDADVLDAYQNRWDFDIFYSVRAAISTASPDSWVAAHGTSYNVFLTASWNAKNSNEERAVSEFQLNFLRKMVPNPF